MLSCWILTSCCANPGDTCRAGTILYTSPKCLICEHLLKHACWTVHDIQSHCPKQRGEQSHPAEHFSAARRLRSLVSLEIYLAVMMRDREEGSTASTQAAERLPLFPYNKVIPQAKMKELDSHPVTYFGRKSFSFLSLLLQGLFL